MPRPGTRPHRQEVDDEDDLFPGQPHDQRGIGVIETDKAELQRGPAERDGAVGIDGLIGQRCVRILEDFQPLFGALVCDDGCAGILERLAAGNMVEMVMTVDQVADRGLRDLPDLGDVVLRSGRPAIGNRIGRNHPIRRDDEHRLVVAIAENVDVLGSVNLPGLDRRPFRLRLRLRLLCLRRRSHCGCNKRATREGTENS